MDTKENHYGFSGFSLEAAFEHIAVIGIPANQYTLLV
jgi:hypothetical protein